MKSGITMPALLEEVERRKATQADYVMDTPILQMEECGGDVILNILDEKGQPALEPFNVKQRAHRQIGTHIGIPASYYDRMLANYPDLLAQNVNTIMQREPARRMLRTMEGDARAFLSDRYRRLDHLDILRVALPVINEMPDAIVESCQITESRMYIKVLNPRVEAEVAVGDIVQAGVAISNSEVGEGSVLIQPIVNRLVCMNGMVVNDAKLQKNHLGRIATTDENYLIYTDETLAADDYAFMLKVKNTISVAADSAHFELVVDKMREARGIPIITNNVPGFVKLASRDFKLSEAEGDGVLNHLIEGKDYSLYGLANAVTRFSQDVESYDRATELESIGYSVLTMAPKKWNSYNQMALPQAA